MAAGTAWILNLDADLELEADRGGAWSPTNAVRDAVRAQRRTLARTLLGPDDLLVDEQTPPGAAAARIGRAFCPTPHARRVLERAGATPEAHPAVAILREVNGRGFSAALGQHLPGATFVRDLALAHAIVAEPPPIGTSWRLKRAFGMAGRGQRVIPPGVPVGADADFLARGIAEGLQIEPQVTIEEELAIHGFVDRDGTFALGGVVTQRCDARGQWLATEPARGVAPEIDRALLAEARVVAVALHQRGYFGPFGIDAYRHRVEGELWFCPRSEINARYSMGFAIGFARAAP